ncbi:F-box domain-containing protein [Mycena venus]|uniref:F-box domain-containing protein n=1 Tax=Mycena venus TaxID=2733690 RepID=A0A8H7CPX8_9AGAR|nr:F-box domain-containing protein [Mycena venus]
MRSDMEADRTRLSDIEVQILDLKRSISALRAEKEVVRERLNSYRYPVLTLPNEIVSEIFVHFLPNYPYCPPLVGALSPTTLTRICQKWREVALATPMLWRAIELFRYSMSFQRLDQMFDLWTRRSFSSALSIRVPNSDISRALLPTLMSHRARWEYLEIYVGSDFVVHGPLPRLRHLDLIVRDEQVAFHDAPLLRTVTINIVQANYYIVLPWHQLTRLTLHVLVRPISNPVAILRHTPNLVHCDLLLSEGRVEPPGPWDKVTLRHLESFSIRQHCGKVMRYMELFHLPALRILRVEERVLGHLPTLLLASLLSKWGCDLQELRVTGERHTCDSVFLAAFPAVPKINFDSPYLEETTNEEEDEDNEGG